jgi:hypothetical protein
MIKKVTAIIASLTCAAFIVSFVPEFSPEVAAQASQPVDLGKTACRQSWPNYEQSCLRDDRQADGNLRVVRVIAIDRSAAKPLGR